MLWEVASRIVMTVAVGIDLGGTNLKGAAVDREGRILARHSQPVGVGPEVVIEEMVALVRRLLSSAEVGDKALAGVGVGAPGPLSHRTGRIVRAANLPGWVDVPLRDALSEKLQTLVVLENDRNAAAFGEYWVGAGGDGLDCEAVVERAKAGDAGCLRIWNEACWYLGVACINIQHVYNPAIVVLGGGMSRAGAFLLDSVTAYVTSNRSSLHEDVPAVGLAKLGYDAGMIGAAGSAWGEADGR